MAIEDDPARFILHQFKREKKAGSALKLKTREGGWRPFFLPLDAGERIYGAISNKYFFTPSSLIIKNSKALKKIYWKKVTHCSAQYGNGDDFAVLTLKNDGDFRLNLKELGLNRSRIHQLFFRMIARWSQSSTFGPYPLSIDEFFALANSDDCIGSNRREIPDLKTQKKELLSLRSHKEISSIHINIYDYDGPIPLSDGILISTDCSEQAISKIISQFEFSYVKPANPDQRKFLENVNKSNLFVAVWD